MGREKFDGDERANVVIKDCEELDTLTYRRKLVEREIVGVLSQRGQKGGWEGREGGKEGK